jgi:hypothetical protein
MVSMKNKISWYLFFNKMTINHNSSRFLPKCIQISLIGLVIIVLSLIPIYIKDRSVETPARSPAGWIDKFSLLFYKKWISKKFSNSLFLVYILYNVTFHVTMLSTSGLRVVPSSSNVTAFSLSTLQDIQNQVTKHYNFFI